MKKLQFILVLLTTFMLFSCADKAKNGGAEGDKAQVSGPIKSFYLEQKGTALAEGMEMEISSKIWYDAKSKNIATEMEYKTVNQGTSQMNKSLHISNEEGLFMIDLSKNTVYKMPKESIKDEFAGLKDYNEQEFIAELETRGKIIDHELYLGKKCIVYEMDEPNDNNQTEKSRYWFYKGMPLKLISPSRQIETVRFDENARIPADRYKVPEGLTSLN